jgi:hypothetical protein
MTDGDKLVEHTTPLSDRQALIESVDVGFMDSGSGKIESRTRFTFKVTRAHGYEAGEYKVTIRDTRDGKMVGSAQTLKFEGENETIDRRAMVFASKGDKKKKDEKKADSDTPAEDKKDSADDAPKDDASADDTTTAPSEGADDNAPPPVEGKPGGCGCKLAGGARGDLTGALVLLGAGVLMTRRRRSLKAA